LELCAPEAIYIELASAPYGIDFPAAKNLGVTVISAPGLPGKAAPRSAGEIMRQVILRYMRMLR
jgi:dipicolinate synthase subunit A